MGSPYRAGSASGCMTVGAGFGYPHSEDIGALDRLPTAEHVAAACH